MSVCRGLHVALGISFTICGLALSVAPAQTRPNAPATRGSDPRSPAESLRAMHLAPGFEADIVACEPLISSPVAIDFGPDGKLWVVEMADYPYGIDGKGKPGGRVKVLEDTDGDGVFDKATVVLDSVNMPNGVAVWREGVLVTAAPDILFVRERQGGGGAEEPQVLYTGFRPGNPQLRVNGLRWGLDGWLYCANGWSGGEPVSKKTGAKIKLDGKDLRINPDTGEIEIQSGMSEFGRDRDDFDNWFGCDNSHPLFQFVVEDRYLRRNPYVAFPDLKSQIVTPNNPKVFPVSRPQKRYYNDQIGFVTSACSSIIYRDDLLFPGESNRHLFFCEPVYNVVCHEVLEPSGETFTAHRPRSETDREFLASEDNWFRPVMARTGPDGALWIVDMYRYMIEHPDWLPEKGKDELKPFYRDGETRGRIYRIYPKGKRPGALPKIRRGDRHELVKALGSSNGTLRDLAQKQIVWGGSADVVGPIRELARTSPLPQVRLQALFTLQCLHGLEDADLTAALSDSDAYARRGAIRLAETQKEPSPSLVKSVLALVRDPSPVVRLQLGCTLGQWKDVGAGDALATLAAVDRDDPFIVAAVLSSAPAHLASLGQRLAESTSDLSGRLYSGVLATAAGLEDSRSTAALLTRVTRPGPGGTYQRDQYEALARFLDALRSRRKQLSDLAGNSQLVSAADAADKMIGGAGDVVRSQSAAEELRAAAVQLLGRNPRSAEQDEKILADCLTVQTPASVRSATIHALGRMEGGPQVASLLLKSWSGFSPSTRSEALDVLLSRPQLTLELLKALEAGTVATTDLDASRRDRLTHSKNRQVQQSAIKILGDSVASDRESVVKSFQDVLSLSGDVSRGQKVFEQNCATCHRKGRLGNDIGPNLASVVGWTSDALLTAILDPNKQVEPRYQSYTVTLSSGEALFGVITADSGGTLSVKQLDAKERTVARTDVRSVAGTGRSLMPDGFESALDRQALADVIRFLQSPNVGD
jgi:putative membrane-bound dehydrogenase-like protein